MGLEWLNWGRHSWGCIFYFLKILILVGDFWTIILSNFLIMRTLNEFIKALLTFFLFLVMKFAFLVKISSFFDNIADDPPYFSKKKKNFFPKYILHSTNAFLGFPTTWNPILMSDSTYHHHQSPRLTPVSSHIASRQKKFFFSLF